MKSINYVALPARASDNSICGEIRLGAVYICDDAHDEIIETNFQGDN